ncbi:MAG TPA: hypothetical protein VF604_13200 [Pyrinomonadaceae bacterium]|jgi:hypothetical protein
MRKDPPRNQPNYKIGGEHLNEYEFDLNKGQITKEEEQNPRPKQDVNDSDFQTENTANDDRDVSSQSGE